MYFWLIKNFHNEEIIEKSFNNLHSKWVSD